jgi:DNA mismatch repair ATPase MutS
MTPSDARDVRCHEVKMTFPGVLFERAEDGITTDTVKAPDFLTNLNLDQIIAAITAGKEEYNLTPFLYAPLHDVDAVTFRHEVMRDLEDARLLEAIKAFAHSMRTVRAHLAELEKRYYEHQKERWFLDAVDLYGDAVNRLARDLSLATCRSRGLLAFREYLAGYASSERFTSLVEEAKRLEADLAAIRYSVFIQGPRVEVRHYAGESDYSAEVEATFERFQQGAVNEYTFRFGDSLEMNHIEARILDGVAELNRDTFSRLANYRATNAQFLDPAIVAFDREIQFYVAYLDYITMFEKMGLHFCYPRVSETCKEVYDFQGFDLALAGKLIRERATPVCNDFYLNGPERIIVVSGPNQGGKTTFARTFGQLHYLASLGYPVPGTKARLYLPDRLFTHFERQEGMTNLRGKLEDDIVRLHDILTAATPRSIIIINEIFASTALRDAIFLSKKIAAAIMDLDVLCVWVTFLDEVASLSEKTVSMVSTVVPDNPAQRTFKIVRRPADGLAYAMSVAQKYRLTYDMIKDRLRS